MRPNRALLVVAALVASATLSGCDKPCEKLVATVCDKMEDKRGCKLLTDEIRSERLSDEWCQATLERLDR